MRGRYSDDLKDGMFKVRKGGRGEGVEVGERKETQLFDILFAWKSTSSAHSSISILLGLPDHLLPFHPFLLLLNLIFQFLLIKQLEKLLLPLWG